MAIKTKKTYHKVMGIDASTNSLAYSIYIDGELDSWGEIFFKGKTAFERLHNAQKMVSAMSDLFADVDLIVFESAVFVQNKKTVVTLAYAFGAIVSALMVSGADVQEIPPITWQYAIGNKPLNKDEKATIQKNNPGKSSSWYSNAYREARKRRTIDWVAKTYGVVVESDNVADAIGVGHASAVLGK